MAIDSASRIGSCRGRSRAFTITRAEVVAPRSAAARVTGADTKSTPWCSDTVMALQPCWSAQRDISMHSECCSASVTAANGARRMSNMVANIAVTRNPLGRERGAG